MSNLTVLIEKAAANVGSEYKLAKMMGLPQTVISDWKAERRSCTPPDRARLAGFAREDAIQELVRATLETTAGTLRGEQLSKVLGKLLHQTGEGLLSVVLVLASLSFGSVYFIRCIVVLSKRQRLAYAV